MSQRDTLHTSHASPQYGAPDVLNVQPRRFRNTCSVTSLWALQTLVHRMDSPDVPFEIAKFGRLVSTVGGTATFLKVNSFHVHLQIFVVQGRQGPDAVSPRNLGAQIGHKLSWQQPSAKRSLQFVNVQCGNYSLQLH